MKLYVKTQGRVIGPLDWERIRLLCEKGRLSKDVDVSEDNVNWFSISEAETLIEELARETEREATSSHSSTGDRGMANRAPTTGYMQLLKCGSCGCAFEVEASQQGNTVRCPVCGKAVMPSPMTARMASQFPPVGMMPPQGGGKGTKRSVNGCVIAGALMSLSFLCIIALAGGYFIWSGSNSIGGVQIMSAQAREIEYQKVMTRQLGNYLKDKFAGKKAIIIKAPYSKEDSPLMVGLNEGLSGALTIVDTIYPDPPTPRGDPEMEMMDSMETWYTKAVLEKMMKGKDADIIITTIGLPMGVGCAGNEFDANCLKGKKVVFAGGSIYEHRRAFAAGCLVAAVTYKPNAEYDEKPMPKELQTAFDKRFLLITSENYELMTSVYPDIFQR